MSAPLNNDQKRYLAQLARRAWNLACARARGAGEVLPEDGERFADPLLNDHDAWRHHQVAAACGKLGLRCCSQDDYGAVKAHFLNLLGQPDRALNADVHGGKEANDRRIVEWKILQECKRLGLQVSYAEAICRAQNRGKGITEIDHGPLGTKRLWAVLFTIRNRAAKKKKELVTP